MKLHIACLFSILSLAKSNLEGMEIELGSRFLADRAVTMSELATHTTYEAGLWTSLEGIVYDLTDFKHPGGSRILRVGGIQGDSLYMEAYNDGDHPFTLAEVVSQPGIVRIGPLQSDDAPTTAPTGDPTELPTSDTTTNAPSSSSTTNVPTSATTMSNAPTLGTPTMMPSRGSTEGPTSGTSNAPTSRTMPELPTFDTPTKIPTSGIAEPPIAVLGNVKPSAPVTQPTIDASTKWTFSENGKGKAGGKKRNYGKKSGKKGRDTENQDKKQRGVFYSRGKKRSDAFD